MSKEATLIIMDKPVDDIPDTKFNINELIYLHELLQKERKDYLYQLVINGLNVHLMIDKVNQMINESLVPDRLLAYEDRH
jgi:hypothetical protein